MTGLGYAMQKLFDSQASVQVGCSECDTKPVDMPRLLEKIRRCRGTSQSHGDGGAQFGASPA